MEERSIIDEVYLDNPEKDKEWMACDHISCSIAQGEALFLYEALSSYDSSELDDQQNKFVKWFEKVTE